MLNLNEETILNWQQDQYRHDTRNHADIQCLHRNDRIKHYGLHYSKYVGRLALGDNAKISWQRTMVDTMLVSLSAANTMAQRLKIPSEQNKEAFSSLGELKMFADASGRFADSCEKIDHLEEFVNAAKSSNQDVFDWVCIACVNKEYNLLKGMADRRLELRKRPFYIKDEG